MTRYEWLGFADFWHDQAKPPHDLTFSEAGLWHAGWYRGQLLARAYLRFRRV